MAVYRTKRLQGGELMTLWCPDDNHTCEYNWHVSRAGRKLCDCGERRNPAYRTRIQRVRDRLSRWWVQRRAR